MNHARDERLAKLRPDFKYEVFSDFSGIQVMNEPKRWAEMVGTFVAPFERQRNFAASVPGAGVSSRPRESKGQGVSLQRDRLGGQGVSQQECDAQGPEGGIGE